MNVHPTILAANLNPITERATQLSDSLANHPTAVYAAAVAGCALVGAAFEYGAQVRINKNRETLVAAWGDIAETVQPGRFNKIFSSVASLAFVGGGLVGAANADAWISFDQPQVVPPRVELVIDKSGPTMLNGQAPAIKIRDLVIAADSSMSEFDRTAWVASSGLVEQTSLEDAVSSAPFGDAPLDRAFGLGIDSVTQIRSGLNAGQEVPSTAIAVITNGNSISGDISLDEITAANSPVFVFDVSEGTPESASLKKIANETGGTYFSNEALDSEEEVSAAINQIKEQITSTEKVGENETDWMKRWTVLGLSIMSAAAWMSIRSKLTTRFNTLDDTPLLRKLVNNTAGRIPLVGKRIRR